MNRLRSSRLVLLAVAMSGLVFSGVVNATETKIGFVDMQRLFDQAPIAIKAIPARIPAAGLPNSASFATETATTVSPI